jgi:hypothetical protein
MSSRLAVDNQNELQELRPINPPQHPVVRAIASFLSYVFHPVFVPVYIMMFLVYKHPYLFIDFSRKEKMEAIANTVLLYAFFPIVVVLLLKALDFIKSIHLKAQRDRIIPLVVCGLFYFWVWYVRRGLQEPVYPRETVVLAMAIFLAGSAALMMNIYMKVSLHAISMGVMLAFVLWLSLTHEVNSAFFSSLALLVTGAVCTSRFIVSDHTQKEVYGGLLAGLLSIPIANFFG